MTVSLGSGCLIKFCLCSNIGLTIGIRANSETDANVVMLIINGRKFSLNAFFVAFIKTQNSMNFIYTVFNLLIFIWLSLFLVLTWKISVLHYQCLLTFRYDDCKFQDNHKVWWATKQYSGQKKENGKSRCCCESLL